MKNIFPFRHVHLDFHTSPLIPEIGADFNPDEFARTLIEAGVNSICLFAKCHHGMSYYPTKVGVIHPNLGRDLLGEQVAACQKHGINTTAYTTVVWDEEAAIKHPEWRQCDRTGKPMGRGPLDLTDRWRWLCMNTPYSDYVIEQAEEIVRSYRVSGIFADITFQAAPGCFCNTCVQGMIDAGVDLDNDAEVRKYSRGVERDFMGRMSERVRAVRDVAIFYNSRLRLTAEVEDGCRPELGFETHVEIESLPSGGWGYNHFPLFVRYFQTLNVPHLGHTGRFHKSWADFGGLKPRAALEYECFRMLASGSGLCVGDQLHPKGRLDPGVYQRIGEVFNEAAKVEPWCLDAEPLADIGVLLATKAPPNSRVGDYATEEGAMRLLLEEHQQYQFIDKLADLSRYRLIVVPDSVEVDSELGEKLDRFVEAGGKLLATGSSGVGTAGETLLRSLGVNGQGKSDLAPEFLLFSKRFQSVLGPDVPPLEYVVYEKGEVVEAEEGVEVLATVGEPYFNRTPLTYTSHQHSPIGKRTDRPAITRHGFGKGEAVYCAYPLFAAYKLHGNQVYKQVIASLIDLLLPEPLMKVEMPSTGEATVLFQSARGPECGLAEGENEDRLNVHLLHYIPQRRTPNLDLVEDVIPLHNVRVGVKLEARPKRAYLAPEKTGLAVEWDGIYAWVVVPRLDGHAVVCFEK